MTRSTWAPKGTPFRGAGADRRLSLLTGQRIENMSDRHRAETLAAEITAISDIMAAIAKSNEWGSLTIPTTGSPASSRS